MLAIAAWISACAARGNSLPARHFTDPLDDGLATLFWRTRFRMSADRAPVFDLAGFAPAVRSATN
jgi:fructuronate reductase